MAQQRKLKITFGQKVILSVDLKHSINIYKRSISLSAKKNS